MILIQMQDIPSFTHSRPLEAAQKYMQAGRHYEAWCLCTKLVAQPPERPIAWGRLASMCYRLGDVDAAVLALRRFVERHPDDISARGHLAEYLGETGQIDEAISITRHMHGEMQAKGGPTAGLLHGLGFFYAQKGNFLDAEKYYRAALEIAPVQSASWEHLSAIKDFEPDDPDIRAMENLLGATDHTIKPKNRIHLCYALGKAYEELGQVDKAFSCVAKGAQLSAAQTPFDIKGYGAAIANIRTTFSQPPENADKTDSDELPCPIFILGVPRSGTTLVEHILASHPEVRAGGEMKFLHLAMAPLGKIPGPGTDDFLNDGAPEQGGTKLRDTIAQTYRTLVRQRFGDTAYITDKNLANAIHIGVIARAMPDARFVYCQRDPLDLAWSCYKNNFGARLGWSNDLVAIAHFIHIYEQLMEFWIGQMPSRILSLAYEDLVEEPVIWTDKMLEFCGLAKNHACYQPHKSCRAVATTSLAQIRQPVYTKAVGSANAYRHHLRPFLDVYTGLKP